MRKFFSGLLAAAAFAAPAAIPATSAAKTCPSGFKHAVIGGTQKCLHAGEYCARAHGSQYRHYHYKCVRVNGTYRLEHT